MTETFTVHYLIPESAWAVFENGVFIAIFMTSEEAEAYADRHNKATNWTAEEILRREG